jgi:hypothetical protein
MFLDTCFGWWCCTSKFEYVGVNWEVVFLGNPLDRLDETICLVVSMIPSVEVAD